MPSQNNMVKPKPSLLSVLAATALLLSFPALTASSGLAQLSVGGDHLEWFSAIEREGIVLRISGPDGVMKQFEFSHDQTPSVTIHDGSWPDGLYTYELVVAPRVDEATRSALREARERRDEGTVASIQQSFPEPRVESGFFRILAGVVVAGDRREGEHGTEPGVRSLAAPSIQPLPAPDQQIGDDLIVTGSVCAGAACVNGEGFGDDALRLKQSVVRLHFEDTSTGAGLPANDWRVVANDADSGGADRFSIEDVTNGETPFTVLAAAPSDSLFVAAGGNVGLRTATPATELHLSTGNTPEIRLEQNASGGLTPQTWDLAGDETGFFLRDVTNGAQVPLRIAADAPTSSVAVTAAGDVGFGTATPAAPLHVQRSTAAGLLMQLERNGDLFFRQKNSVTGQFADMNLIGDEFRINFGSGGPGPELRLTNTGSLIITGTYTPDYVFDPDYPLMPLAELADFVVRERHLPNVPNAAEIRERGLNVNVFPMQLLEKIEELTLYAIEQDRRIAAQEATLAELEELRAANASLEVRLAALERILGQVPE